MISKPQIIELAEDVWCVRRRSYFVCSYIVKNGDSYVLIDTSMNTDGKDTFYALDQLGVPVSAVSHILLTHWHNDHSAAMQSIIELSGCRVYCHKSDQNQILDGMPNSFKQRVSSVIPEYSFMVLLKGLVQDSVPKPITADSLTNDLPAGFIAIHTPGHTDGHMAYFFEKSQVLFAGDALASVGNKIRLMARPVTLDVEKARASAIACLELDFKVFCPGHRRPLLKGFEQSKVELLKNLNNKEFSWPFFG